MLFLLHEVKVSFNIQNNGRHNYVSYSLLSLFPDRAVSVLLLMCVQVLVIAVREDMSLPGPTFP